MASGFAVLPARASSSVFERNLITNGDAEAGSASADGTPVAVPGWNIHGTNFAVVAYDGRSGSILFPPSAGGPPDHGANVFTGGLHSGNTGSAACGTNSADVSCATQTVGVSQGASLIDAGGVTFSLSGWLGGFGAQADNAVLTATFRNVEGNSLATAQIGPVTAAERGSMTKLLPRSSTGSVPVGTRDIDLRLDMTWAATDYNDGYADSLSLVLHTQPANLSAWGRNVDGEGGGGQIGDGTTTSRTAPVPVSSPTNVAAVAGGYFHTLALKSDGTVWAWGRDNEGQLGNGTGTSSSTTPAQVPGLSGIVAVAAAGTQSMALKNDGTIYQWGLMPGLNSGAVTGSPAAVSLPSGVKATAIAAGVNHSLALGDNRKVFAWGDNTYGQLGNGTNTAAPSTSPVTSLDGVVSISAGQFHSVALTRSATIKAWGLNDHGQLGDNSTTNRNAPVTADVVIISIPEFPPTVTAIDAGENHTLALLSNETVFYTGLDGADPEVHVFVQKAGITTAIGISGGEAASFVLLTDRTVQTWGDNACGQLGIGLVGGPCTGTFSPSPVITQTQVSRLSDVSVIEAGHLTNYAITGTPVASGITNLALTLAEGDSATGPGVTEAALADIPLTDIPEDVEAGPGDAPVGKSPVGKSPVGKSPVGKSPVGKSPVGKSPVGKSPVGKSPVGKSPVGKSPVGKSPVGKSPLSAFILIRPGGWPEILAHTSGLVGATPQSVTWDQLLNDPFATDTDPCTLPELRSSSAPLTCGGTLQPPPLTLDQIVWSTSPIANLSFLSLLMGDVTWNDVANTAPGGWCAEWAETGHPCASTADLGQTIFESEANGLPSYLTSLPTKHVGHIVDPSKTLFWDVTLIDLNVNGSFLGNVLIADIGAGLATATDREAARGQVVDCARMNCSDASTDTLGDAYDNQTSTDNPATPEPEDILSSALRDSGTFGDLGTDVLGTRSLASIEIAFLDPRAISWEDVPLLGVLWETFDEDNPTQFIRYNLDFDVDCRDSAGLKASVHIPNDFRYRPGSSKITAGIGPEADIGNPTIDSETGDLTWDLSEFECTGILPQHFSLRFQVMPGFNKGTFTSDASVQSATEASAGVDDTAPVTVVSAFTNNSTPATAASVPTNSLLVVHPTGDPQYFAFTADPGDQVQVSLSHQIHDGDVVLYAPSGSSSEPLLSANTPQSISFGKNPLDDPALNEATDALPPESLQDITIVPTLSVAGISNFRGTEVDAVTTTVPDGGGPVTYTLQLDWFNDDVGPEPAVATIRSFEPVDLPPCQPRSFGFAGQGVVAGSTPSIGPGVNTLLLFDQKRTGDMFGSTAANDIKSSLEALASSTAIPGVSAQIVYLDSFASVNAAFSTADADPCSPANNNSVVKTINDAVAGLGTETNLDLANVRNVVIVGDEYLIPHARLLDETTEGNEREFTGDTFFGSNTNELGGAFAAGYFLSDAPYGTRTPVSLLGKTVYLPQWAVGRLGGSDQTIKNAINSFIASNGLADPRTTATEPRTALVTDYDGFSDAGLLAFNELQSQVGTGNAVRLTGPWTRADYAAEVGASDPPDVIVQNGHHDQYRMLPGAFDGTSFTPSDLFTTQDIGAGPAMQERVLLSIGCHFALDFPAELAPGATGTDADRLNYWAKAYLEEGTAVLVGNLGYGYFDTSTTAFDESLMDDFVSNLDEFPAGEALRQAEVEYFTTMASFTPYDRKVLQQTIMWGFPMTRMPGAPAPAPVGAPASAAAASSASSLSTDPISGLESTTVTVTPTLTKRTLGDGTQFYEADDGTQATHPYPILPLVSTALPLGSIAKGAVPLSITYSDDTSYTAAFANATIDSSAIESAPPFEVGGYPSTLASIGTAVGPDGSFLQRLNVTPGLFRPTDATTDSPAVGLFRRITNSKWLVTYGAAGGSALGPTISEAEAIEFGGNTAFVVDVDHTSGIARVFLQAFRDTGAVDRVELSNSGTGTRWSGGTTGTNIFEYWVFAISNAGTSASSTNKAVGYVPQPPPPPPSGGVILTTDPDSPGADGWFDGDVEVTVTPDEERISIDGDEAQAGPRTVTGNGVHVVDAVGPDETIDGSILVPIDAADPTITIDTPPSGVPEYLLNQVVAEDYECFDEGSGVASCSDDNPGSNLDTSTVGLHTFTVTATDFAGHTTTLTRTYHVLYKFSGFFQPVDNPPTTNVVRAGSIVPVKWRITDANGVGISDPSSFVSVTSSLSGGACSTSTDVVEDFAAESGLQYLGDGNWQFNWKTLASYKGKCRTMKLNLKDGSGTPPPSRTYQTANFLFK